MEETTMKSFALIVLVALVYLSSAARAQPGGVYVGPRGQEELPWISEETQAALCSPGHALVSLRCRGSYCDNIKPICALYPSFGEQASTQPTYWTDWFSEEKNGDVQDGSNFPKLSDQYSLAVGLQCRGRYCDDLRLLMLPMRGTNVPTMDSKAEYPQCRLSVRYSEEAGRGIIPQPNPPVGKSEEFIRRVGCSGGYCDNLQIEFCKVFHKYPIQR
jgi:hypothetical protein